MNIAFSSYSATSFQDDVAFLGIGISDVQVILWLWIWLINFMERDLFEGQVFLGVEAYADLSSWPRFSFLGCCPRQFQEIQPFLQQQKWDTAAERLGPTVKKEPLVYHMLINKGVDNSQVEGLDQNLGRNLVWENGGGSWPEKVTDDVGGEGGRHHQAQAR